MDFEDPFEAFPLGTTWEEYYSAVATSPEQAQAALQATIAAQTPSNEVAPQIAQAGVGVGAGAGIIAPVAAAASAVGVPAAIVAGGAALAGYLLGGAGDEPGAPTDIVPAGNGGVTMPAIGMNREAYLDYGGVGKYGREGAIAQTRTTEGTGLIAAGTFRAWDPIKQRYYQLEGDQAYSGISFTPGTLIPGAGYITKAWVTNAWRKDGSLATTQMGMTSDGRMISLSETGVMKQWRPYKSIVLGKSMKAGTIRRFANRVESHAKSLRKVLKNIK